MMKNFKHNISYKIISFVLAIIFWILIYNSDNPIITKNFSIPIIVENFQSLAANSLQISEDYEQLVDITIKGRTNEVNKVNQSNFAIIYDFSTITSDEITFIEESSLEYIGDANITYSIDNNGKKNINVEKLVINEGEIQIEVVGEYLLANNYSVVDVVASPRNFTIKDVESLVDSISYSKVIVDVSDISGNTTIRKYTKFYDENNMEILELSDSIYVDLEVRIGKEVPVQTGISGSIAEDISIESTSVTPNKVIVTGNAEELESLVYIQTEFVNVTNVIEDSVFYVSATNIPIGCELAEINNSFNIEVDVEKLISKTFAFSENEIDYIYQNSSGEYSYYLLDDSIEVTLYGKESIIEELKKSDLEPQINVNSKKDGQSYIPVSFTVPDTLKQMDFPTAEVKILRNTEFTIYTKDIVIFNMRLGQYSYAFKEKQLDFILSGFSLDLTSVDTYRFVPSIDADQIKEGEYEVTVLITIPETVELKEEIIATLIIIEN